MNILLLGPAGAGKGTQTRRLCEHYGWTRIGSGELLRAAVAAGTATGIAARAYLDAGALVPDALVERLVLDRTAEPDCRQGVVLDGFPRTVAQAQALDAALAVRRQAVDLALLLEAPEAELLRRLANRLTCRRCAATYHPTLSPPATIGICDRCGGDLYVRDDDQEVIVQARHAVYERETEPLLTYYARSGRLRREDSVGSINDVWRRVTNAIEETHRRNQAENEGRKQANEGTRVGQAAL